MPCCFCRLVLRARHPCQPFDQDPTINNFHQGACPNEKAFPFRNSYRAEKSLPSWLPANVMSHVALFFKKKSYDRIIPTVRSLTVCLFRKLNHRAKREKERFNYRSRAFAQLSTWLGFHVFFSALVVFSFPAFLQYSFCPFSFHALLLSLSHSFCFLFLVNKCMLAIRTILITIENIYFEDHDQITRIIIKRLSFILKNIYI